MPGGLGPRFALEAGFLILLAAVAAYARLDSAEIIAVMGGGWLLASIFEVVAARRERLHPEATWDRRVEAEEPVSAAEEEQPEAEPEPVFPSPRPMGPVEPALEQAAVSETPPAAPSAPKVDDEATGEIELPKRRKWFRRGPSEPEPAADEAVARPSARHVRLIRETPPPDEVESRKDAEAGS
jgi:hypothetical protein